MVRYRRSSPLAPLLSLVLLAGVAIDTSSHPQPGDAESYHRCIREAEKELPRIVGDWIGRDVPPNERTVELLRPNVIYQRSYVHSESGQCVNVLIVHSRNAHRLQLHYPPICYPSQGMRQRDSRPVDWRVGGRRLTGTEYEFAGGGLADTKLVVANLLLMPEGQVMRDMDAVYHNAWDYRTRFYGAGQLQIVFEDAEIAPTERKKIFKTMAQAHMPIIEAIIATPQ